MKKESLTQKEIKTREDIKSKKVVHAELDDSQNPITKKENQQIEDLTVGILSGRFKRKK